MDYKKYDHGFYSTYFSEWSNDWTNCCAFVSPSNHFNNSEVKYIFELIILISINIETPLSYSHTTHHSIEICDWHKHYYCYHDNLGKCHQK